MARHAEVTSSIKVQIDVLYMELKIFEQSKDKKFKDKVASTRADLLKLTEKLRQHAASAISAGSSRSSSCTVPPDDDYVHTSEGDNAEQRNPNSAVPNDDVSLHNDTVSLQ